MADPAEMLPPTPPQTIGPFFGPALAWPHGPYVVDPHHPGAISIEGRILDGAGEPVTDALVETWQANQDGCFAHRDDPRGEAAADFGGFGRCATDAQGRFRIVTVKPGCVPGPAGHQAPHLDVSVFARGLMNRLVTRIYFADEAAANAADPVLRSISDASRRTTLVAVQDGSGDPGRADFRFDIRLQGEHETVFFTI